MPDDLVGVVRDASWRAQVIGVHGVEAVVFVQAYELCCSGFRGQVDVLQSSGAFGAAVAVFAQQVVAAEVGVRVHIALPQCGVLLGLGEEPAEVLLEPGVLTAH